MTLDKMAAECHEYAMSQGFWPSEPPTINEADMMVPIKLALVMSELAEALEVHREVVTDEDDAKLQNDRLGHELVDAVVRLLDLACYLGVNLDHTYQEVMESNRQRERGHGKRY